MAFWKCGFCSFMYDEWYGDSRNGIPAGTPLSELAGGLCSRCGMQGGRHERQASLLYTGMEAEYYDQFVGKAGIAFYRDWIQEWDTTPTVLELGVGTARIAAEIAQTGATVCGVDWSPDMLKVAATKRDRLFKDNPERLELIEADAMHFDTEPNFSHIICPDGFLQHYTMLDEHVALLQQMRRNLRKGGWVAIDLLIPPAGAEWNTSRRKRLPNGKIVYQQVSGSTSLAQQLFHCSVTYESFVEGREQVRYRAEREYALMTPKELGLLLAAEGFAVTATYEKYGCSQPWATALLPEAQPLPIDLGLEETLEGVLGTRKVKQYREDVWMNGGYPFDTGRDQPSADRGSRFTLLAKVR
ncbi:hypothetical protein CIG75_02555 [Tumebacillus algifaecis]|uniref:Methyltransferase domain-containing protein n=1 Tax=Tumebacillus algifaecis TaxID=1214604 RepID=A0A223D6H0_9BACL|nr:methyltransferase domain-containing protein [Tumebacillus algifaecis]ASS77087.1 hypothetical protein CIG75_02555 [Tumebacillus algifaecis]